MTEHTPGPWNARAVDDCCWAVDRAAEGYGPIYPLPEADARLIAAAPELLVTLKNLLQYLGEGDQDIVQSAWWVNDKKAARIAIAKATGEEISST